ncbi:Pycsar system effector family protein [Streptosporangium sp. NPDC051023]|uniref:Pycsar system effector family protein n=1 Tax=Streptosporangium sp. NPDC051023 TaxID=3155410 RepID=UPI00344B3337
MDLATPADPTPQAALVYSADLFAAADAARTEISRTDTKAGVLLAFTGTAFSILAALSILTLQLAHSARVGLAVAVMLLGVSSSVALNVIRPRLPRPGKSTGVMAYAELRTPEELLEALRGNTQTRQAADVLCLAQIARAKHRRLQRAVGLVQAALVVVVVGLLQSLL